MVKPTTFQQLSDSDIVIVTIELCVTRNVYRCDSNRTRLYFFFRYCTAATADLESHLRPNDVDFQDPRIKDLLSQWRQIVIFGALRTMLAPLVETAVLLDRFLFLSENNLSPILKPIFDARLSPRNFLLFSVRKKQLSS